MIMKQRPRNRAPMGSATEAAGFRYGDRGVHTSRTMMFSEIDELLLHVTGQVSRGEYAQAIIDENVLSKQTMATRKLTNQRLGELYGLSPKLPIFRVLHKLWAIDPAGRPLMALLVALARDPLLRSTIGSILPLPVGQELVRSRLLSELRYTVGDRLNDATLDKVARNVSSTWTQSGHLEGRVRKVRKRISPSAGPVALAIWMGHCEGLAGEQLLDCVWCKVLDRTAGAMVEEVLHAKQRGLLHAVIGGGVVEIDAGRLGEVATE